MSVRWWLCLTVFSDDPFLWLCRGELLGKSQAQEVVVAVTVAKAEPLSLVPEEAGPPLPAERGQAAAGEDWLAATVTDSQPQRRAGEPRKEPADEPAEQPPQDKEKKQDTRPGGGAGEPGLGAGGGDG